MLGRRANTEVSGPNASRGTFTKVSAGGNHTCAIKTTGSLTCWGADHGGQVSGPNAEGGTFIPRAPGGAYVYWTQRDGKIGRANLDGTEVNHDFIGSLGAGATDLVVAGGHFYWSNQDDSDIILRKDNTGIGRVGVDGSDLNRYLVRRRDLASITVGGSHLYWGNYGFIAAAKLGGDDINDRLVELPPDSGYYTAEGLAVDTRYIYWAWPYAGRIGRANLGGGDINHAFITGAGYRDRSRSMPATSTGRTITLAPLVAPTLTAATQTELHQSQRARVQCRGGRQLHLLDQRRRRRPRQPRWQQRHPEPDLDPKHPGRCGRPSARYADQIGHKKLTSSGEPIPRRPDQRQPRDEWRLELKFSSSQPASIFGCSLDGSPYRLCTSPKVYSRITAGAHTFKVKAQNLKRLPDRSPAMVRFKLGR